MSDWFSWRCRCECEGLIDGLGFTDIGVQTSALDWLRAEERWAEETGPDVGRLKLESGMVWV